MMFFAGPIGLSKRQRTNSYKAVIEERSLTESGSEELSGVGDSTATSGSTDSCLLFFLEGSLCDCQALFVIIDRAMLDVNSCFAT